MHPTDYQVYPSKKEKYHSKLDSVWLVLSNVCSFHNDSDLRGNIGPHSTVKRLSTFQECRNGSL